MKWTDALALKFVEIYFRYDCLWNPLNPAYSIEEVRQIATKLVITEFKNVTSKALTMKETSKKLKELKSVYLQETHILLKKARSGIVYEPSPVWFNEVDRHLNTLPCTHRQLCKKDRKLRKTYLSEVEKPLKSNKSITKAKKENHSSKSSDKF